MRYECRKTRPRPPLNSSRYGRKPRRRRKNFGTHGHCASFNRYVRSAGRTSFHARLPPPPPREGMVVLVGEKLRKRSSWRIGRILQLNVSEDGGIRSATLKIGNRQLPTSTGKWDFKCETITRPLCTLYPLELPEIEPVLQAPESDSGPPAMAPEPPPSLALDNENNVGQDEEIEIDLPYDF